MAGGAAQCGRAPRAVNNSWGGGSNNPWYDDIIAAWRNVGIAPVFSAGNSGPGCGSTNSPGDRPGTIGVAAIQLDNLISNFSSVGPTATGAQKPDIAAPGQAIVSASHLSDTGLATFSGTSMSAPHITGVIALILAARPGLSVDQVQFYLTLGAVPHASQDRVCNGVSENVLPNYHVGYGRVNAYNSA